VAKINGGEFKPGKSIKLADRTSIWYCGSDECNRAFNKNPLTAEMRERNHERRKLDEKNKPEFEFRQRVVVRSLKDRVSNYCAPRYVLPEIRPFLAAKVFGVADDQPLIITDKMMDALIRIYARLVIGTMILGSIITMLGNEDCPENLKTCIMPFSHEEQIRIKLPHVKNLDPNSTNVESACELSYGFNAAVVHCMKRINRRDIIGFEPLIIDLLKYWFDNGFFPRGRKSHLDISPYGLRILAKYLSRDPNTIKVAAENIADTQEVSAEDAECCICYDNVTSMIRYLPCNHMITCDICSRKVIMCPICRQVIRERLKVTLIIMDEK
jgi:hypothetical protein